MKFPRYFKSFFSGRILRFDNEADLGFWGKENKPSTVYRLAEAIKDKTLLLEITALEAAEILKGK